MLYSNELRRLCQGVGKGTDGTHNQCVRGADTFKVIFYADIPLDRRKEITYTKVVFKVHPHKADPHRTHITINGKCICYPGDFGTPTGSLELIKMIINSIFFDALHGSSYFTFKKSTGKLICAHQAIKYPTEVH